MRLLRDGRQWEGGATVAVVGNFDGVHLGHRMLLAAAREEAGRLGAACVAVSFDPHPSRVLRPETAPRLLTTTAERIRQLATTGIDALLLLSFDLALSRLPAEDFVRQVLVQGLRVRALHEGATFRFGHRHAGTVERLAQWGEQWGFGVRVHPQVQVGGEVVSSSRIRERVAAGQVNRARRLLGRVFAVRAGLSAGEGIGRRETVPTLNLARYQELLPANGVYITCARVATPPGEDEGAWLPAVTNVGVRPTFGEGGERRVETHLLRPPAELLPLAPGTEIELAFLSRLREERRFDNPPALRAQIMADAARAEGYFAKAARRAGLAKVVIGNQ